MNVLSLFDGMSCGQLALDRLGIKVDVYLAAEIDKYAMSIAKKNYPNTIHLGDVTTLRGMDLPKIDLLMGGSPCQGFSFAGKQLNFEDEKSKLFFEYVRLLKECNPKYFLLENNKMKKEYQDVISEFLGVEPVEINSSLLTAQNRKRLYWTNISIVIPQDKKIHLSSIVGEYEGIWVYPRGYNKGGVQGYKGKSPTVTISSWQHNFFVFQNGKKRKFTVNEVQQLQGVPSNYTDGVTDNQQYKMLGNGWTVDVIKHIFKGMK